MAFLAARAADRRGGRTSDLFSNHSGQMDKHTAGGVGTPGTIAVGLAVELIHTSAFRFGNAIVVGIIVGSIHLGSRFWCALYPNSFTTMKRASARGDGPPVGKANDDKLVQVRK